MGHFRGAFKMQIRSGNETGTYVTSFPGHTGTLFPYSVNKAGILCDDNGIACVHTFLV